jgi:thiol-disulfide isomerase/thioredoxin
VHKSSKGKNIIGSLLTKFDDTETICYKEKLVFTNTTDTAVLHKYYEEHNDSTGYLLSYNVANYRFDKLYYQGIFNAKENKLYWHSESETSITDYNNPPKYMSGLSEISFSLLTYVKYLKQTLRDYPKRVSVEDTIIKSEELYKIAFLNPDGLPLSGRPLLLLNDTTYPLRIIVDKTTAVPKYTTWGKMFYTISDIRYNCNESEKIWSVQSEYLPEYFKSGLQNNKEKDITAFVSEAGELIPKLRFNTLEGTDKKLPAKGQYHMIVFLSDKCGASIAEIKVLNELSKNNKLRVSVIFIETESDKISDLIKTHSIAFEVLQNIDKSLNETVKGFPVNYLFNPKGEIIYSVLGNRPNLNELILSKLE